MSNSFPHHFLRFWLLLVWLVLTETGAKAQQLTPPNTRRCVWVRLTLGRDTTDFALRDTLTVVPASVAIEGRSVAYDNRTGTYRFIRPGMRFPSPEQGQPDLVLPGDLDSVLVCYRVLPVQLSAARYLRPRSQMDSLGFLRRTFSMEDFTVKEQILSTPGINKTGNLSRGVSFGNTQNVFVNSSLNLQLEGRLTDQITLTAAISDQNVPFQPEGNTQQLQEFDRIYITLTHPRWNLTAGDVVLRNKPDYFLRFYKNIQGAAIEANFGQLPIGGFGGGAIGPGISNTQLFQYPNASGTSAGTFVTAPPTVPVSPPAANGTAPLPTENTQTVTTVTPRTGLGADGGLRRPVFATTTAATGVAKGKFASIDVAPLENVQGPYRLRGPNGEQFIIVLANSERVYLDGRLMVRGFDFDYIIDYNQAEVTFSPRHLITRNSRIKIDFEYSDFNYARSLFQVSHYQQLGRLQVHSNFYREADNPDNSPNLTLDSLDRVLLRGIGDNVSRAVTDGAKLAEYDRRQVQYNRAEVGGAPVYQYSEPLDSTQAVYNVLFTNVGAGQGNYRLSATFRNANGRVYEYVGERQGDYSPVRVLPTPLQKQLVTVGASYQVDSTSTVFVDLASSDLDLNRFSPESAKGQAMRVGYTVQDKPINLPGLAGYKLRSTLDYEYTSHRFSPIDRYRDIEFDRNWSASTTTTTTINGTAPTPREENILNFALGVVKNTDNAIGYRLSRRYRAGEVSGLQHWLDVAHQTGNVQMRGSLFLLNSEAGRRHSTWARGEATARYVGGPVVPGYAYRFDKNRVVLPSGDSLTSANYFDEHAVFVQSRDSARTRFRLDYSYRRDQTPNVERTALRERGRAQTWQGTMATRLGSSQELSLLATYRDLASLDSARQRTVLSKLDWNASFFQNTIRSELSYAVATGRELKRDYSFIAVNNGQGTHYYGGDTNNNSREDKEEFFEAQTLDAQYRTHIKVYLPTDDYILAFTNRFSYRLTTNAPRGWREGSGLRSFVGRFSDITTITLDRKTTENSLSSRLNPFAFQTEDSLLLSLNKLLRNTLYFNRSNPIFGAEFTVQQAQQKVLLTQGSDIRNLASQSVLLRRTLAQSFTGRLTTTRSIRQNSSNYLLNRNFRLLQVDIAPEISYQPTQSLRLTGTYLRTTKQNTAGPEPDTRGTFDELGVETRVSQVGKRTLSATTRYVRVGFEGEQSSLVGLEILNALRPGSNFTWNLNLEQRLSNGLNVTLAYDGRKANGLGAVHTGRMQVAVLF
ncbi:hypothetical protein SAMN06265337_2550 [Hymenobacter gelipurpurascens]|uniref:Uncharacterized protein n=1 Tax=Hymenobacter gelipurpurascens TaxID=89968 RepID=A0A212U9R1_9BACT|nr:hypothetical protein [Hymenobacter gelipurpurascens]SNC74794.1 hypothetical protein SAMN06265337_2550 [Hymenobacter gelipurpurascens]